MSIKGLYAICDASGGQRRSLPDLAAQLLCGGASILQLRVKGSDEAARRYRAETACRIMQLKSRFRFQFIINDDPVLARDIGADGVHIGADDTPITHCRRLLGPSMLIGYSAHDPDEALAAEAGGADYVAFGAIFPSPTKGPGHPVQGLAKLRALTARLRVPSVAIGGINHGNVVQVLHAGADAVAMISALNQAANVVSATRQMRNQIDSIIMPSCP